MGLRAFETYSCDVCNRERTIEASGIARVREMERWRRITCDGVKFNGCGPSGSGSLLICEYDDCLDKGFEMLIAELRRAFAERKRPS